CVVGAREEVVRERDNPNGYPGYCGTGGADEPGGPTPRGTWNTAPSSNRLFDQSSWRLTTGASRDCFRPRIHRRPTKGSNRREPEKGFHSERQQNRHTRGSQIPKLQSLWLLPGYHPSIACLSR